MHMLLIAMKNGAATLEKHMEFLTKLKMCLPYDSAICNVEDLSQKKKKKKGGLCLGKTWTQMLISALFVTAPN